LLETSNVPSTIAGNLMDLKAVSTSTSNSNTLNTTIRYSLNLMEVKIKTKLIRS